MPRMTVGLAADQWVRLYGDHIRNGIGTAPGCTGVGKTMGDPVTI
jgi:hypothetical protein